MTKKHIQTEELLNYSDGVYMTIDCEWTITYINKTSEKLLGIIDKELIGTDLRETLPDIVSKFYKVLNKTLRHQEPHSIETLYGPTQRTLELKSIPIENGVLAIFHDVTTRNKDQNTIRNTETQHKVLFDTLSDAIVIIDTKGIITDCNHAVEKIFLYKASELIGLNVSVLLPENERQTHEEYTAYTDLNEGRILNKYRELFGLRKDGVKFSIDINVSPLNIGGDSGYMAVMRDITDRKVSEAKMINEKNRAEKANQAKSEFLANMSHELRTPMHGILGYAQLGISKFDKEDAELESNKIYKYFNNINVSGQRLLVLLNNLLDLSKLESGMMELEYTQLDLAHIVSDVFTDVSTLLQGKNLTIDFQVLSKDTKINADREKIIQVIFNLLTNAIKFSNENEKLTIVISDSELEGEAAGSVLPAIQFSIKDNGIDIPNDELTTVFNKFIQSSRTKTKAGGTGLGLAITKNIIDKHKGKIWVESSPQQGTIFSFKLPR